MLQACQKKTCRKKPCDFRLYYGKACQNINVLKINQGNNLRANALSGTGQYRYVIKQNNKLNGKNRNSRVMFWGHGSANDQYSSSEKFFVLKTTLIFLQANESFTEVSKIN